MIQFDFSESKVPEIIDFESRMLAEYSQTAESMLPLFEIKGYTLRLDMGWHNAIEGVWSASRIAMKNGYACYVYCHVEKNGKPVLVSANDGEADYYMLQAEWNISSITRQGFHQAVTLCNDMDDVESDIGSLLARLPN